MKNTRRKTFAASILIAAGSLLLLAGCRASDRASEPGALSVLVVNTQGRKTPDMNNVLVQNTVLDVIRSGGSISVVNVDGSPDIVLNESYELDDRYANAAKSRLDADASAAAAALIEELGSVVANDPEVDILKAFEMASNDLQTRESSGDNA